MMQLTRETKKKTKRQLSEWEKIESLEYSSNLYNSTAKDNHPMGKGAKDLSRLFSKEDLQVAKAHEKMLNILDYKRNVN